MLLTTNLERQNLNNHDEIVNSLRECVNNYAKHQVSIASINTTSVDHEHKQLVNGLKKANIHLTDDLVEKGFADIKETLNNRIQTNFQDNHDGQLTASEAYALAIQEVLDGAYWDKYIRHKQEVDYV